MKKLVSAIASLTLLIFCSNANATVIKGSDFKAGLWSGKAYLNDNTGEYAECYVYRAFNNGFYLGFSFKPSGFVIYVTHQQENYFKEVDSSFQVVSQVDRYTPIYLSAQKWGDDMVSISYDDFDAIFAQLSEGNTITFSSIFGNLRFSLKGSSRALRANLDCESRYENYGASSNQALGTAGSSSKDTFAAIAFSTDTGANGYAYQYDTRTGAEARALKECRAFASDCTIATWFSNACGALAVGDGNGWGSSWDDNIVKAERDALASCRSYGNNNCEIDVSICSYD